MIQHWKKLKKRNDMELLYCNCACEGWKIMAAFGGSILIVFGGWFICDMIGLYKEKKKLKRAEK